MRVTKPTSKGQQPGKEESPKPNRQGLGGRGGIRKSRKGEGQRECLQERGVLTRPSRGCRDAFEGWISEQRVTFRDVHVVRGQPPVYHCGFEELIHCPHLHPHPHLLLRRCLTGGLSAQMSSLLHTSTDPSDHCGILSALACTLHSAKQEPRPRGPPESWGLEQIRVQWRLSCLLKPRGRCRSLQIRF